MQAKAAWMMNRSGGALILKRESDWAGRREAVSGRVHRAHYAGACVEYLGEVSLDKTGKCPTVSYGSPAFFPPSRLMDETATNEYNTGLAARHSPRASLPYGSRKKR